MEKWIKKVDYICEIENPIHVYNDSFEIFLLTRKEWIIFKNAAGFIETFSKAD